MLNKLNSYDFDKVYKIMEDSFPPDEHRPYEEQKELLNNPNYCIYVSKSEVSSDIQGFMAVWQFETLTFIEHFAVDEKYRNAGLGSEMLQDICDMVQGRICLEVELPYTDMAKKRIGFYERNGFTYNNYQYVQPAISNGRNPIPLRIMTTESSLNIEEFNMVKELLYKEVYRVSTNYIDEIYHIRLIEAKDNSSIEQIIRSCLIEYGGNHEGTAWADPNLGRFSEIYSKAGNSYWVAVDKKDNVVAGVGIGELEGISEVCELQKMYCLPEVRGLGVADRLMDVALEYARDYYKKCYLETLD
ncbi:MAG: GNAT family N-acetyltransferase, partial [Lachnospiraceae bacterium]|nr:GNAT family N-acetyltransferase [Lachnospiraceae bacterium]